VEAFPQVFFIALIREIKTLQIKVVGLGVLLSACRWRNREFDLQRVNNRARDLILNGEDALQFALKRIRPNVETITRADQLCCDPNAISFATQTALENILHV